MSDTPTSTETLADLITETLEQLTFLLSAENTALAAGQARNLDQSAQEKTRLTHQYESQLLVMKGRKAAGQWQLNDRQLQKLQKTADVFHSELARHRRLVQAAKSVGERMLSAITKDVADRQAGFSSYGQGNMQSAQAIYRRPPVSVALNQMV